MMRTLAALLLIIACGGCAADGSWEEALKDLRGDNMRMRTNPSALK